MEDGELDLEDLKDRLAKGYKITVVSNYYHLGNVVTGLEVRRGEEGQLVEVTEEEGFPLELELPEWPKLGKYQFKVDFVDGTGEYCFDVLRDVGYCSLEVDDPERIERMFQVIKIEYPENPRQLRFKF